MSKMYLSVLVVSFFLAACGEEIPPFNKAVWTPDKYADRPVIVWAEDYPSLHMAIAEVQRWRDEGANDVLLALQPGSIYDRARAGVLDYESPLRIPSGVHVVGAWDHISQPDSVILFDVILEEGAILENVDVMAIVTIMPGAEFQFGSAFSARVGGR